MRTYGEAYLRFAHAMARVRPRTEVFTMGTRLTRVTAAVRQPDPERALAAFAEAVPDWSGGTRLGEQRPGVPADLGAAGAQPRLRRRDRLRRLGARRRHAAAASRWRACTGWRTG